jgi:site-specific recombinase XerD
MTTLITQFLTWVGVSKAPKTLENYAHYLSHFLQYMGNVDYQSVTIKQIEAYHNYLIEQRYSDRTINYHLSALKSLAHFAKRHEIRFVNPDCIELPKYVNRRAEFLTTEEVHQLLDFIPTNTAIHIRNKALLHLLYSTGMRIGEVYRMNVQDIDLVRKEFTILGKGNRYRLTFLSGEAEYWLKKYLDGRDDNHPALFINYTRRPTDKRLTITMMENIVRNYARQIWPDRKITCHTLRHSFATDLLHNGAEIKAVQEMLGHSNIQTTAIYLHYTNTQLGKVYEKCHI